ncbi:MAG: mandelate racemase/muconate lactonizing enzyme family protein [Alphaproteobacteria bacterium]|nr:mandelate racemase/muconate lactonizing enzyme family protein [Alphaproteobacteria bacterium]
MFEFPKTEKIKLERLEPILLRTKIDTPVITSFGTIPERAVLLVRVEDKDGAVGWGETFGNFPMHGAENRAHLIRDYIAPIILSNAWDSPVHAFDTVTSKTHIMTLQSGEPGSFAQAIAGVDIALWDLAAKKANQPLYQFLGGNRTTVPTYASGLNPSGFEAIVEQKLSEGYNAFKIKTGFGRKIDFSALTKIRDMIGDCSLMVDVNQGWDLSTAMNNWPAYSNFNLNWIEEPLPADRPLYEWSKLATQEGSPIAAGENLIGDEQFDKHIKAKVLGIIQPDMCKWGGFTKILPLAKRIVAAGLIYCPHFLAGPIGIMAAAHCLAVAGGNGVLEVDANVNPIRERLTGGLPSINNGHMLISKEPGLGLEPIVAELKRFSVS